MIELGLVVCGYLGFKFNWFSWQLVFIWFWTKNDCALSCLKLNIGDNKLLLLFVVGVGIVGVFSRG